MHRTLPSASHTYPLLYSQVILCSAHSTCVRATLLYLEIVPVPSTSVFIYTTQLFYSSYPTLSYPIPSYPIVSSSSQISFLFLLDYPIPFFHTLHDLCHLFSSQRLRERERFDRQQAAAVSMVGTPKAPKEQSGSISEVWKSMSLEDTIAEPGESSQVGWD